MIKPSQNTTVTSVETPSERSVGNGLLYQRGTQNGRSILRVTGRATESGSTRSRLSKNVDKKTRRHKKSHWYKPAAFCNSWRRRRDSNSRSLAAYSLSRRAPSTTRTLLRKLCSKHLARALLCVRTARMLTIDACNSKPFRRIALWNAGQQQACVHQLGLIKSVPALDKIGGGVRGHRLVPPAQGA